MTEHQEKPARSGGGWIFFVVGLAISLVVGWVFLPVALYSKKLQPFPFNHAAHIGEAGLECEDCHAFRDDGSFTGTPPLSACLECHTWDGRQNEVNKAETAFLEEFVTKDGKLKKSPPWLSYAAQPDTVYFSHIAHVKMAKISCEECHGDRGRTTTPQPYYQNRISTYSKEIWDKMKMSDCADCHTKRNKPEDNACFVCHK